MGNYFLSNKGSLMKRHYLLLANQQGHWFNAAPNAVRKYQAKYKDDFCIVLYRSGPSDDAYVLPFRRVKSLFIEDNLTLGSNNWLRWHGSIRNGYLNIRGAKEAISVGQCYNAFELLKE